MITCRGRLVANRGNRQSYFLLVLMCPICPQFAHLRCVPEGFDIDVATGDVGEFE